jgi:hypothetical protein
VEGEKMAPTFPSNFENGAKYSLKLSLKILTFPSNFPSSLEGCPSFFCTSKEKKLFQRVASLESKTLSSLASLIRLLVLTKFEVVRESNLTNRSIAAVNNSQAQQ